MKRIIILSLFTLIIAGTTFGQQPQPKPAEAKAATPQTTAARPTIDQILERYVQALGGRAAIEKLKTRESKGTFEIIDTPLKGVVESYNKAPNKLAIFTRVPGLGDFLEGYDGNISWAQDPANGLRDRSGVELAQAKFDAEFYKDIKMKELYPKMELKGTEKVGGRDAYVILATPAAHSPEQLYFDVQTGLLVRADVVREGPQGKTPFTVFYEDYREVDGVRIPFLLRQTAKDFSVIIKLDSIKHNVSIDDAKFSKPVR
jgi:hypothetical protein